eukprot:GFUD01131582.1.p1 GENE.GFUD01131582.1~~GFUD01131582.1.p1  ORF type:complete len:167 (-),score=44.04 GFUD01131582.1:31-531(-)
MLAWVVAILLLPIPYLYDNLPQFRFRLKFSVYYLWLTLASFFMIPLSLLRPGSVVNARLGSALMRPLSTLLGLGWEVEGEVHLLDREEACVILANHQSSIDLLGMFHIWSKLSRVTAIAKQSLMYYGSFGELEWVLRPNATTGNATRHERHNYRTPSIPDDHFLNT